jgi:hypothetical protein
VRGGAAAQEQRGGAGKCGAGKYFFHFLLLTFLYLPHPRKVYRFSVAFPLAWGISV